MEILQPPELLGAAVAIVFVLAIGVFVSTSGLPRLLKRLIYIALAFRVIGAVARYAVLFIVYGGSGDARGYYGRGLGFAERFWDFDFSPFYDPALWYRGQWTGTSFVSFPSGIVLSIIGPSFLGEFIIFSLLAFIGLVGFVVAFKRSSPYVPFSNYALWIWLFPSLWFWPSSVGKDAIILMGLGLAVWGLFGPNERRNWLLILFGVFLVTVIRPQVTAVFLTSVVIAQWLALGGGLTKRRVFQGAFIILVGLTGIVGTMRLVGVDALSPDGVVGYLESESEGAATEGSAVGEVGVGVSRIPLAVVNIIARPFPWEARNALAFASALEIVLFWGLVWYRRRNVWAALRSWRSHPLLRLAVPFVLLYAASLGMVVYNLGIIARQRIFLYPFLFMLLEAVPPSTSTRRRRRRRRRRTPPPERVVLSLSPEPRSR